LDILNDAVASLRLNTLFAHREVEELRNEVRWGIDNSLIKSGSRHRCARVKLACDASRGGRDWEIRPGCRSIWDWLDVHEQ